MNIQHKNLASGRWRSFSLVEQLANVGSEIERAIKWRKKNADYSTQAFERALELIDLTVSDKKNIRRLKEILRMREMLVDDFAGSNEFNSSDKLWQNYFYSYNYASRLGN